MNCKKMIYDLEESGLTQTQIADRIGSSQGYVSDLKTGRRGKRISLETGQKLQDLWKSRCNVAGDVA
jgi:transcriptional regulator with XRE-family HTH domain